MSGKSNISIETQKVIAIKYSSGERAGTIAKEYGIDRGTVLDISRRQGIRVRFQDEDSGIRKRDLSLLHDKIVELRESGVSQYDIGKKLGISQSLICRTLRKLGLPTSIIRTGCKHPGWKGGRVVSPYGYIRIVVNKNDEVCGLMADKSGYAFEHRVVMARYLNRPLRSDETVHHIDGDKTNNDLSNLSLRIGKHGRGYCLKCADCGSINLIPTDI
jgi:hypothetical protein